MRRFLPEPPPADALTYGNLKWVLSERVVASRSTHAYGMAYYCKMWRGKSEKPFANYSFRSKENRQNWIVDQCRAADEAADRKAQRRVADTERVAAMCEQIQVGTLLHYSWGYDQTNCEFFQVVAKSGRRVTLREIGSVIVDGSERFMCEDLRPDPGNFIGEPITKMIGAYGISFEFGTATPCQASQKFYSSHYA